MCCSLNHPTNDSDLVSSSTLGLVYTAALTLDSTSFTASENCMRVLLLQFCYCSVHDHKPLLLMVRKRLALAIIKN